MPNLYGRQEDEDETTSGESQAAGGLPGQSSSPSPGVTAPPPQDQGAFVNLEDIFKLNQGKAKEMADKATGQVEGVTKGLRGAAVEPGVKGTAYNTPYQGAGLGQTVSKPQANHTAGMQQPAQPQRKTKEAPALASQPAPTLAQRQQMVEGGPAGQRPTPGAFDGLLSPQQAQAAIDQQAQEAKQAQAQERQNLGQYQKADEMLDAYASDEGQGLLEQVYGPGVTAYDTALMNQAGGRDEFSALSDQFKDYDDRYAQEIAGNQIARDMQAKDLQGQLAVAKSAQPSVLGDFGQPAPPEGSDPADPGTPRPEYGQRWEEYLTKAGQYDPNILGRGFADQYTNNPFLHPHKLAEMIQTGDYRQLGGSEIGQLAQKIGETLGITGDVAVQYLAQMMSELPENIRAWIANLTSNAGSDTGQALLNAFGGMGDQVHGLTTGMNSSDEEWQLFQQMFADYLEHNALSFNRTSDPEEQQDFQDAVASNAPTEQEKQAKKAIAAGKTGRGI